MVGMNDGAVARLCFGNRDLDLKREIEGIEIAKFTHAKEREPKDLLLLDLSLPGSLLCDCEF